MIIVKKSGYLIFNNFKLTLSNVVVPDIFKFELNMNSYHNHNPAAIAYN
mgnify:CR=1 FL=1